MSKLILFLSVLLLISCDNITNPVKENILSVTIRDDHKTLSFNNTVFFHYKGMPFSEPFMYNDDFSDTLKIGIDGVDEIIIYGAYGDIEKQIKYNFRDTIFCNNIDHYEIKIKEK